MVDLPALRERYVFLTELLRDRRLENTAKEGLEGPKIQNPENMIQLWRALHVIGAWYIT